MSELEQKPNESVAVEESVPPRAEYEMDELRAEEPSQRPGRGLAILALVFGVAAAGGSYVVWTQVQQQRAAATQENQMLHGKLEQMAKEQQALAARLEDSAGALEQVRSDGKLMAAALDKVNERLGRDRHDWILAEVDYLLQLANRRVLLERDVDGAIAALQAADQRLAFLKDARLTTVRGSISDDIQALRAVPQIDVDGIALELGALSKAIDNLVLAGTPTDEQEKQEAKEAAAVGGWRGVMHAVWADIRSLVIIRRHDAGSLPLTTPDQRMLLRQNLRLKLETARLSLLRGHAQIYTSALKEADAWVERFYDAKSPVTVSTREALGRLAAVDIAPPMPAMDQSLDALRKVGARLDRSAQP